MIFLSSTTADPYGHLAIREYQVTGDYDSTARISKTKLLDGTTSIIHSGVSTGDRSLSIDCRLSPSQSTILRTMYEAATRLRISYWDGVMVAYVSRLQIRRDGVTTIIFDLIERSA